MVIHLKRHDIFFKFLFITANAIHWFNPLVYLMQKEAVVDMELSCDEAVVEHTGYEGCKAYTETLLATLCRQHCKTTNLSTQFYGGKQVMKKRFKNILHRTAKKNGILLLVLVISLSLILCTVTGCSMAKDENKAQPPEEILMQNEETQPQIQETAAVTEAAPQESGDQSETELKKAAHTAVKFVSACIRSDTSEMRTYLADSFEGVPEAYLFPEVSIGSLVNISATYRAGDISLSRNEAVSIFSETVPIGSTVTLVVPMETNSINFIVGLIRQEEGWKVKDYYIEQASGETALDDNQQIATVAQEFVSAYFSGDRAGLKSHLAQSYNGKYEVYTDYAENSGTTVSDMTLKGFPESREWQLGDKIGSVSLEYRDSAESDSFNYLNMYFIKEETGWKIYFYGIEK